MFPHGRREELSSVLAAGLADGDANEAMSAEALSTLLRRAYAAKGTNLKDDYYAAVNKSWLDDSDIPAGLSINGPFYGLSLTVNEQIAAHYPRDRRARADSWHRRGEDQGALRLRDGRRGPREGRRRAHSEVS